MANTNVAQDKGKLFLPKTADAIFKVNGIIAFVAKANTSAQVNIATTQNQIKAGQTNSVIGVITTEKAVDVTFSTPEWQPEFLAANIGTTIRYGKQNFYIDNVPYTAGENGIVELAAVPADEQIQVEVNNTWVAVEAKTTSVDLSAYGVQEGDCLSIIALLPKDGKEISLLVDTDPTIGELILTSPIFKGTKGQVGKAQYTFPSFSLSGNWTQAFSSDASYDITGTAIAVAGEKCGESETYGYYREYIDDEETMFTNIVAAPSVVELTVGETQKLTVYGVRGALSDKEDITATAKFAVAEGGEGYISVTAGEIKAVAEGETSVVVTDADAKYKTTVTVTVTTA